MPEIQLTAANEQHKYYPLSGTYHVQRNSFWTAGQDSHTKAPAQQPDLFESLNNIEPITRGVLERRRGYTLFSNTNPTVNYTRSYGFRSDNLNLRELVWSSTSQVDVTDETGTILNAPLFTPSGTQAPRMVLSRDYGYFADGVAADSLKWDGTQVASSLSKWGIDINSAQASVGPNSPATASTSGSPAWSNPGNVFSLNGLVASCTTPPATSATSGLLLASNYSFSGLSNATISGILVEAYVNQITYTGNERAFITFGGQLLKGGTPTGTIQSSTRFGPGVINAYVPLGGSNNLWGTSWLGTDIQSSTFGVQVNFAALQVARPPSNTTQGSVTVNIDHIRITVFTQASPLIEATGAAGNITLLNGRVYFYAFQNSKTGTTSGLSPASLTSGAVTSVKLNLSAIPTSTDTQVDTVIILATADGGDETTLYELTRLPIGTTTYTDNTPDALTASVSSGPSLLTSNVWQDADIFGNLHGIANNNPPPNAFFPTKHKGRLYLANGPNLYFSKNLDDITTSTGTITTKWEEAWPATNVLDISQQDETIQGLLSDGETLWIGTERSIRRLVGDSPTNFQIPEVQFNEAGLLSQEVWKIVMYEGQPVGVMWITPDLRVMSSDFNTYQDVGTPIQDVLNSINNAALPTAHACFVSGAAFDLYMLYIPTGISPVPNTICIYNVRSQRWTIWNPHDAVSTSLFNISVNGTPQWLFAANLGPLYFWDPAVNIDRNGGVSNTYPVSAQTSWLDLGDATMRKALNQMLVITADVGLTLTVFGATTDSDLDTNAVTIVNNVQVRTGPLGDLFVPLAGYVTKYRWYKFLFTSSNSTTQDVLDSFNLECVPYHRW